MGFLHEGPGVVANITPLLLYACQAWPIHASIALLGGAVIPSLARFLEIRVLQWLEVMSLTQSSPEEALIPLTRVAVCVSSISYCVCLMLIIVADSHARYLGTHC